MPFCAQRSWANTVGCGQSDRAEGYRRAVVIGFIRYRNGEISGRERSLESGLPHLSEPRAEFGQQCIFGFRLRREYIPKVDVINDRLDRAAVLLKLTKPVINN